MQNVTPTPEQRDRALRRLRRLTTASAWGSAGAALVLAGVSALTYAGASDTAAAGTATADAGSAPADAPVAEAPVATPATAPAPVAAPTPLPAPLPVAVAGSGRPHATTGGSR